MQPASLLRFRIVPLSSNSTRFFSDIYIGSNVSLRREMHNSLLHGVKVAAVHDGTKGLLVAKILADYGAEVKHFTISGHNENLISARKLDLNRLEDKEYLHNVLRKSDVLIDGTGEAVNAQTKVSKNLDQILKRNGQLIVAPVIDEEPFAAMHLVATLSMGLYVREKHTCGQVVDLQNTQKYLHSLQHYAERHK